MYLNVNNPVNYQLQGFGQNGVRTISTDQLYIQGEYYRVLVAEEDSYVTAVSVLGDDLTAEFVYAGTTIYGLFTEVSVSSGSLTAYIAGPTDIEDVWAYINAYGQTNAARIEAADCAKDAIAPLLDKYYAKASLVMVPSLYKTSIVYSERPLTTDGQLAFTRSNDTATRVGPDGYIEKVRTNLALQSQTFDNVYWNKLASSVIANATTAPDGTLTAEKLVENSANAFHALEGSSFAYSAGEHSWSVFAKAGERNVLQLLMNGSLNINAVANFNLTTGVVSLQTNAVASIESVGNGWFRCSMVYDAITATVPIGYYSIQTSPTAARTTTYLGDGTSGLFLWGAQMTTGVTTNYIPTTTAAVSVGPVANLPRLNYPINSDGSVGCPSLLLEPQRTNLLTYSEQFDNAAWTKSGATITANATTSPDGYQNADKLVEDTSSSAHRFISSGFSTTSGLSYTASIYAKQAERRYAYFRLNNSGGDLASGTIDLQTGVVTQTLDGTLSVVVLSNGWVRITATGTSASTSTGYLELRTSNSATYSNYTGNGTSGIYAWGAQVEVGAYATSYIPTLGAAVTRGADAALTSANTLGGLNVGTFFIEMIRNGLSVSDTGSAISLRDNSGIEEIRLHFDAPASQVRWRDGNNGFADIGNPLTVTAGTTFKILVKTDGTTIKAFGNGAQLGANYSAVSPYDLQRIYLNGLGWTCNQTIFFPTALSDAEAIAITTL